MLLDRRASQRQVSTLQQRAYHPTPPFPHGFSSDPPQRAVKINWGKSLSTWETLDSPANQLSNLEILESLPAPPSPLAPKPLQLSLSWWLGQVHCWKSSWLCPRSSILMATTPGWATFSLEEGTRSIHSPAIYLLNPTPESSLLQQWGIFLKHKSNYVTPLLETLQWLCELLQMTEKALHTHTHTHTHIHTHMHAQRNSAAPATWQLPECILPHLPQDLCTYCACHLNSSYLLLAR